MDGSRQRIEQLRCDRQAGTLDERPRGAPVERLYVSDLVRARALRGSPCGQVPFEWNLHDHPRRGARSLAEHRDRIIDMLENVREDRQVEVTGGQPLSVEDLDVRDRARPG